MKPLLALSALALACAAATVVQAQAIQRIVGPDGRVTYTDRAAPPSSVQAAPPTSNEGAATWPLALRQAAQRYPVTLYTGDKCSPCDSAREHLKSRGIPFAEKTVKTPEDGQAFARLGADNVLPLITIGSQRMSGYREADLGRYLDAAAYPAQSQLPRGHRNPPAQPLAQGAANPAPAPSPATEPPAQAPASAPVSPPPANPAGIRF